VVGLQACATTPDFLFLFYACIFKRSQALWL
jgi:hypothetical protein